MDDLISRAATLERMKSMAGCATCDNYNYVRCRGCNWDDAMNIVEEMANVDAVPVVHGRWIYKRHGWAECSECHHDFLGVYDLENSDAYCRHCGAKMDGGAES